jgi:predicted  nucleic acid-binding Zn-ribbon protein
MTVDPDTSAGGPAEADGHDLTGRLDALDRKIDTVAGAMAAVASTQTELLDLSRQALEQVGETAAAQRADLALALDALAGVTEALERSATRTDDRLAAIRDAAAVPVADLQALLTARTERTDAQLQALLDRVEHVIAGTPSAALGDDGREEAAGDREVAGDGEAGGTSVGGPRSDPSGHSGPAGDALADHVDVVPHLGPLVAAVERLEDGLAALLDQAASAPGGAPSAPDLSAFDAHVEELRNSVRSLSWQLPELAEELAMLRGQVEGLDLAGPIQETAEDLAEDLRQHTDVALAGTLRVLDERFQGLRSAIVPLTAPPGSAPGMGFEAGAVMGAVQAAWSRLEQRLDHEFDQLGHQLVEMDRRIEQALATAEAAANRPVVTGEQLRKTASSVKEAVQAAREQRRLRRGGPPPKGLGPG